MKHTKGKWICDDIAISGELLIQNEAGTLIAEVYHKEDVPLIKSAPDLLEALDNLIFYVSNDGIPYSQIKDAILKGRQAIKKSTEQ